MSNLAAHFGKSRNIVNVFMVWLLYGTYLVILSVMSKLSADRHNRCINRFFHSLSITGYHAYLSYSVFFLLNSILAKAYCFCRVWTFRKTLGCITDTS